MPESRSVNWNEIVGRHAATVCRVALRILRNTQDAEDVSQDVFAEAFALQDPGGILNWEAFLVRVTTLRSLDRLRRRRTQLVELRDDEHHYSAEPADALMADELSGWLTDALTRLPEHQATIFLMIYAEQMSRLDVAEALGISPDAVSSALYKARQRLLSEHAVFNRGGLS